MQTKSNFAARQKIGRLGSPEEVASMFVYLASDEVRCMLLTSHNVAFTKMLSVCFCSRHL